MEGLDNDVRLFVYRFFLDEGRPPVAAEVAPVVGRSVGEVEDSFRRLADGRVLVLAPGTSYVWMANPLSALSTAFQVVVGDRLFFGNCIYDALGVVAMLDTDAEIRTWCPDCGAAMALSVTGPSIAGDGVIHFAVPAAHWWDDIGST
jgi:hypothetical protein